MGSLTRDPESFTKFLLKGILSKSLGANLIFRPLGLHSDLSMKHTKDQPSKNYERSPNRNLE